MFLQHPFQQYILFWKQLLKIMGHIYLILLHSIRWECFVFLLVQSSTQAAFTSWPLLILLYTVQKLANKKALFIVVMLYFSCAFEQKRRVREVLLWRRKRKQQKAWQGPGFAPMLVVLFWVWVFFIFFDSEGREFTEGKRTPLFLTHFCF